MNPTLHRDLAELQRLTVKDLRLRYAEVFGETTNAGHRTWLVRRIAWRLQARAEGDLSERARRRAAELADDADLRMLHSRAEPAPMVELPQTRTVPLPADPRLPMPGTILTRPYKGALIQVRVLAEGFAEDGQVYHSLSAVAKAITGSHCNGFLFFQSALNQGGSR